MNKTLRILGVLVIAGLGNNLAWGAKLPPGSNDGVQPASNFFLCQSAYTGEPQTYSCRDYRAGKRKFRAYFQGGTTPRAIATLDANGLTTEVRLLNQPGDEFVALPVTPPKDIPATAKFQGSGVCLDDHDKNVPCGVFIDKAARTPQIARYMVFYDAAGAGVVQFDKQEAGPNRDAIPAELAYQIGVRLMSSDCCHEEGLGYLKMALSLFPDSRIYRNTYEHYRVELAASPGNAGV